MSWIACSYRYFAADLITEINDFHSSSVPRMSAQVKVLATTEVRDVLCCMVRKGNKTF